MKTIYPIIIYPKSSGETMHYVEIPDIDRGTQGETLAGCMDMARDALSLWAVTEMDAGRTVPEPSDSTDLHVPTGAVVTLIDVDIDEYRRRLADRAVHKN